MVAANNSYACQFPQSVQEEIYGDGPVTLVANASVQKAVHVTPEKGGFRLSGR